MSFFNFVPFLIVYGILSALSCQLLFINFREGKMRVKGIDDLGLFFKLTGIYILICMAIFIINVWMLVDFDG